MKWDGHTHTKFCYHGSKAELTEYIDRAVSLGFQRYTVSEHSPLPDNWVPQPELMKELAMPERELDDYMEYARKMKDRYAGQIELTIGLEMDYLYRYESYSERILERWGHVLEDVIVSVHYLPGKGGMRCIDFTADDFRDAFLSYYGSMNAVVEEYYNHVEMAVEWAAKLPMRKRLGHINLIEKFSRVLPEMDPLLIRRRLEGILPKLSAANMGLDVNVAGFRVSTCKKAYVPVWFLQACQEQGIPLVYGSDAHRPEHVGAEWDWFSKALCKN